VPVTKHGEPLRGGVVMYPETEVLIKLSAIEFQQGLAFQGKGFEIRAVLEDYFRDSRGATYDVALMMRPLIKKDDEDFQVVLIV
jgi:hypothetical protein